MIYNKIIKINNDYHYRKQIIKNYLAINDIKLPPQLLETLIFYTIYGINRKTNIEILANKIAKSPFILSTYKSRLVALNLITKIKSNEWKVIDYFTNKDTTYKINITFEKTS
jgi:hypothetical protein